MTLKRHVVPWPLRMQVPSTWRSVIEDSATLQLFLGFYGGTTPPLSNSALECLVSSAGGTRS